MDHTLALMGHLYRQPSPSFTWIMKLWAVKKISNLITDEMMMADYFFYFSFFRVIEEKAKMWNSLY